MGARRWGPGEVLLLPTARARSLIHNRSSGSLIAVAVGGGESYLHGMTFLLDWADISLSIDKGPNLQASCDAVYVRVFASWISS